MNPPWVLTALVLLYNIHSGITQITAPVLTIDGDKIFTRNDDVTLTCTFTATPVTVKWVHDGELYTVNYDPSPPIQTITLPNVDHSHKGTYNCIVGYLSNGEPFISNAVEVRVSDIYLTGYTGPYTAIDAARVALTCNYDVYEGQTEPADPTWYLNGVAITSSSDEWSFITHDTAKCSTTRQSIYDQGASPTATYTDNKNILCGGIELGAAAITLGADVDFIVRHVSANDVYVTSGDNAVSTCTVYGDQALTVTWEDDWGIDQEHVGNAVSLGSYANLKQEVTLTISDIQTNLQKKYTCKVTYSSGPTPSRATSNIIVYEVNGLSPFSALTSPETPGSSITLSCDYNNAGDVSSVKWYQDTTLVTTKQASAGSPDLYSVEKLATNTGEWKCVVSYTNKADLEGSNKRNLYFRKTVATTDVHVTSGTTATLSCVFHGDATDSITWYDKTSGSPVQINSGDAGVTNMDLGSYSNFERATTLELDTAVATGTLYTCSASYTATTTVADEDLTLTIYPIHESNEWATEWDEDWNEWGTEWDDRNEAYFGGAGAELNVPGMDSVEVHIPEMEVQADWYDIMQVLRDLWD